MHNIDTMTEREMDVEMVRVLGYSVYHYDKDVAENCYYCLMDGDFNPVVMYPFRAGERKTEQEAWQDAPHYTTDANATREMEAELQRRGLADDYIEALIAVVGAPDLHLDVWPKMGDLWVLATATPADRCRAALRVVLGRDT